MEMDTVKMELDMPLENKVLSLMQPTYIPWLGYFNLIKNSDEFVIYTTTQLNKRSWQTRNRIKSSNGNIMLSIPIRKTLKRDDIIIKDAKVENKFNWQEKHLKSIKQSYSKAPFFDEVYPLIQDVLMKKSDYLIDYSIPIILCFIEKLNITTRILFSDQIQYEGKKDKALISICKQRKATTYLSVIGAKDYILREENLFSKSGIKLQWSDFNHPHYKQFFGAFESHLSIIDSIFFNGFENVKNMID